MSFDDEDPTLFVSSISGQNAARANHGSDKATASEDELEDDDTQMDFRVFLQAFSTGRNRQGASSKALRRGEKDFESHGTRAQQSALESSRNAMHEVLSYTRIHKANDSMRGWYFPDRWAEVPPTEDEGGEKASGLGSGLFARERVVAIEIARSMLMTTTGRVLSGIERHTPGWLNTWLLPEEALFLVERGSLDLWWPIRGAEDILPVQRGGTKVTADSETAEEDAPNAPSATRNLEDHEIGFPVSVQAAYALFIGQEGERGKITLEKYQVYANLRRTGYRVQRATITSMQTGAESPSPSHKSLWQWLFSLLRKGTSPTGQTNLQYPPSGPLVKPGLYRSYRSIYAQLALIPRHAPGALSTSSPADVTTPSIPSTPRGPFKVHFNLWKTSSTYVKKTQPPPPEFRIAVVDARSSSVPTLDDLTVLLESTPWDPPEPPPANGKGGAGLVYKRLKHGWRNVVVAVVDSGFVNYLTFGEMAFGEERLFEKFDRGDGAGSKGKRSGGRNPRGGRGGRGRGRERGQGR